MRVAEGDSQLPRFSPVITRSAASTESLGSSAEQINVLVSLGRRSSGSIVDEWQCCETGVGFVYRQPLARLGKLKSHQGWLSDFFTHWAGYNQRGVVLGPVEGCAFRPTLRSKGTTDSGNIAGGRRCRYLWLYEMYSVKLNTMN